MHISLGTLWTIFIILGLQSIPFTGGATTQIEVKSTSPTYSTKSITVIPITDGTYGTRNVSYWVTDDGLAVIDGDIIYGTVEKLLSRRPSSQRPLTQRAHSVFPGPSTWPGAVITYKYDSDATQAALSATVASAIAVWKEATPFLTFNKIANSDVGQNGVLTISDRPCGGCNAMVGFANAPLTMNLQQTCFGVLGAGGKCGTADAIHAFGHALGLFHEHQRVDREQSVHYNCQNLDPTCPNMPAGKTCCDSGLPVGCCGHAAFFDIQSGPAFDASGPYDIHSIMHPPANAFAKAGTNTLTPVAPGIVIPATDPTAIDSSDASRVCKLYSAECPQAIACRDAGCPTLCKPIFPCINPNFCNALSHPQDLCCAPRNCQHEISACTVKGCDFLK